MGIDFFDLKKEKQFLALDIGTEAVKTLIFKKENKKIIILGSSIQYFERYGVFDGRDFERDLIKKTISKAIEGTDFKQLPVLVSFPVNIFKARIVLQSFERKNPKEKISKDEEKVIYQECFKKAQKEISQRFWQDFGILANDLEWISQKVLEIKIDGYPVLKLKGYHGKNLEFKILATFLPKSYLENMKKIFQDLQIKNFKIVHLAENLAILWGEKRVDGIFFDIGGEISQVFLVKDGKLDKVWEFKKGGKFFSQRLSENLGLEEESARNLKEKYANGFLSPSVNQRIREIFLEEEKTWQENLKFFAPTIFLFGGGSLLPEIQLALKEKGKELKFIYPRDLAIEDSTKELKSPQYIPCLLICYYG